MRPGTTRAAEGPDPSARAPDWRTAGIVCATAACLYANALANGFALDDNDVIARNPLVHTPTGVVRAFAHSYWPESTGAGQYRPLAIGSFALDWSLGHGAPMWLHAVNVAWHVAACLLVWWLLSSMLSRRAAAAGALVFAVHPVHVEAVANLVGRSELMCTAFVLAALLAHRRGRWTAIAWYAAALASKETGIAFLVIAAAADLLFAPHAAVADTQQPADADAPAAGSGRRRRLYAGYLAVTALYAIGLAVVFHGRPMVRVAAPWAHSPTGARLLTALSTVVVYLQLMVFPLHLHVDYMPQVVQIAYGPTARVLVGAAILAIAGLIAIVARRTAPVLVFAVVVAAAAVAPVANLLFPSGIVVAERTLYLPSVGLAIAVGWAWDGLERWTAPSRWKRWVSGAAGARSLASVAAVVVLAALAARTWIRTPIWRDNKSAMIASLHDEPESYRAHERAADVLARAGDTTAALREYQRARALYPRDPYLYTATATLLVVRGASGATQADQLLDSARLIEPSVYDDLMRRAWVRFAARDYQGTIDLARRAYLMARDSTGAIMLLTQAAQRIDDVTDADAAYRLALTDHPRDQSLHHGYANMLMSVGDSAAAARERRRAGED